MSRLISIYAVCKSLLLSPVAAKELIKLVSFLLTFRLIVKASVIRYLDGYLVFFLLSSLFRRPYLVNW